MRVIGAILALALAIAATPSAGAAAQADDPLAPLPDEANATSAARVVMDWVAASHDNNGRPYMVIDKVAAEAFVFDADGALAGKSAVLIGSAKGDESAPGIGERELRNIPPSQRTTPAGRFVAKFGPAAGHQKVLWVDWSTAVSLHPVVTANKREHRLQRLASPTPDDNRITYGCINVPAAFYRQVIAPMLADTEAIVYILPEERALNQVFAAVPRGEQAGSSE